jgi:hypothetical protein
MSWNSSLGMFGYPSITYFDPWYGCSYDRGLPNYFAYCPMVIGFRAEILLFGLHMLL